MLLYYPRTSLPRICSAVSALSCPRTPVFYLVGFAALRAQKHVLLACLVQAIARCGSQIRLLRYTGDENSLGVEWGAKCDGKKSCRKVVDRSLFAVGLDGEGHVQAHAMRCPLISLLCRYACQGLVPLEQRLRNRQKRRVSKSVAHAGVTFVTHLVRPLCAHKRRRVAHLVVEPHAVVSITTLLKDRSYVRRYLFWPRGAGVDGLKVGHRR